MFRETPIHRVNGEVVFALRQEVFLPDPTDLVVEVTQATAGKLDLIAFESYGKSELWWVIAELNQIVDPMTEIQVGVELRVPRRERVFNILTA